jgi:hypothetical protein
MSLIVMPPGRPPRFDRKLSNVLAIGGLAAALAGCTSDVSLDDFNLSRKISNIAATATTTTLSFQGGRDFSERPVTQADLVGPQGQCADTGLGASTTGADGQPNGAPVIAQSGIALQMTECEVVQRAGGPSGIEFGNNPGERNVVLTYTGGARPGIYRFAGGRLYSIERVAEPAAAPKAQKKSAPAKKRPPA